MNQTENNNKRRMASVICRLFGMLILIGVIAVLLPVTLPRLMGLQTYHVMSGSMEPAIPTGSLVYVRSADPMKLEKEDIIAFYQGDEAATALAKAVVKG